MICGEDEFWKQVVGLESRYEVSSHGRIRNRKSGIVLANQQASGGYLNIKLYVGLDRNRWFLIHRLVAEAFIGQCPIGRVVNHKDGKKRNNSAANLEYVTPSENNLHALALGLSQRRPGIKGRPANWEVSWSAHPRKLDAEMVLTIRERAKTTPLSVIAKGCGLHRASVWAIVNRKRWSHVA